MEIRLEHAEPRHNRILYFIVRTEIVMSWSLEIKHQASGRDHWWNIKTWYSTMNASYIAPNTVEELAIASAMQSGSGV